MKRILFSTGLMIACLQLAAQQDYFIFVQDVQRQPFYVRMEDKSFSSSAGGHLILPGLKDSVYNLFIGFPRSKYPEQLFRISIDKKDRGYELKNMNGSWQLFDLQRLQLLKPFEEEKKSGSQSVIKKTDSYSALLAAVVDDSAVLYATVLQPELVKKADTVLAKIAPAPVAVKTDTEVVVKTFAPPEIRKDTVVNSAAVVPPVLSLRTDTTAVAAPVIAKAPVYDRRDVVRFSSENLLEGKQIIYLDRSTAVTDTIRIIIPRL